MEKMLFTVKEASEILNNSERTVRRDINDGFLEAVKIRGCLRITRESIERRVKEAAELFRYENGLDEDLDEASGDN